MPWLCELVLSEFCWHARLLEWRSRVPDVVAADGCATILGRLGGKVAAIVLVLRGEPRQDDHRQDEWLVRGETGPDSVASIKPAVIVLEREAEDVNLVSFSRRR